MYLRDMNCRRKLGEAISGVVLLSAGWAVVGCGGTNPNDSTNPYNRSGNYQNNLSPGSTDGRSPSPNEVVSVAAVVIAEQDSKRIDALFQGFKKLGNPPKRVFLMGSTLKSVERWIAPAKAAKIELVPLPGQVNATEWKSIIVKCGKNIIF